MLQSKLLGLEFNGSIENSLSTILNVLLPPTPKVETLSFSLDIAGIYITGGSGCSAGVNTLSHVLQHLEIDTDKPAIRFSFSKLNTKAEIDTVVEELLKYK